MEIKPIKGITFIPLMILGIPGNVYIMLKFFLVRVIEKKLLPSSIILIVLALMNLLVLLARGTPEYMNITGLVHLLNDDACKLIVYTYRTSRAMSISITSLLSCHQCILIAPTTKVWVYLKPRMSKNMVAIIIIIFIINMLLYCSSVTFAHAKNNSTNSPYTLHLVSCKTDFLTQLSFIINGTLLVVKDFVLVALMTLTSSYIVNVLLNHQKNIKDMRSSHNVGKSMEYKASRAVILLIVLYVVLFGLDSSLWIYSLIYVGPDMNDARVILACAYSALSPILIIATNPKLHDVNCLKRFKLQNYNEDLENKTQLSWVGNYNGEKKTDVAYSGLTD
ncbi:olfactory receptor class A-like protein 1 [Anomaloglossus baeobatrachus]|uniref:olfactory receptor class A-like protein 1 n=1 Tax=Anomaloglossus baeobatrachus TaxID=238106 RepID=UPI003F4FFDE3